MTIMRQPEAKTSAAASGSAQMLNSAEAVMLPPSERAPPMTTTGPRCAASAGSARMASARLVIGPMTASATEPAGRAITSLSLIHI